MDLISWLRRHGGFIDARLQIGDGPLGRGLFAKAWADGTQKIVGKKKDGKRDLFLELTREVRGVKNIMRRDTVSCNCCLLAL